LTVLVGSSYGRRKKDWVTGGYMVGSGGLIAIIALVVLYRERFFGSKPDTKNNPLEASTTQNSKNR
jgi:hypothetical protein